MRRAVGKIRNTDKKLHSFALLGNDVQYTINNHDLPAVLRALIERKLTIEGPNGVRILPPRPLRGYLNLSAVFRRKLVKFMPRIQPWTAERVVCQYTGSKRHRYQQALDELRSVGFKTYRHTHEDLMIKCEAANHTAKPDTPARLICPVHPVGGLVTAKYIKPIEHHAYRAIDMLFGMQTVCKCLNATMRGQLLRSKWDRFRYPVAISLDAKKFDQSVSDVLMKNFEFRFYKECYKDNNSRWLLRPDEVREMCAVLGQQLKPHGSARCEGRKIDYDIVGMRSSGVMNTSLGNVLCMCMVLYMLRHRTRIDFEVANDGDDSVVILEKKDYEDFVKAVGPFCLIFGFRIEIENNADVFERIVFCGSSPVDDGSEWVMVRNVHDCLNKDLVTTKLLNSEHMYNYYRRAKGLCGKALANNLPVLGAFYRMMRRGTTESKIKDGDAPCGMDYLARGMRKRSKVITARARASFMMAFGICPSVQHLLEEYFNNIELTYCPPKPVYKLTGDNTLPTRLLGCRS